MLPATTSLIEGVAGATEDVANLVADQLLHMRARWAEIFSRIKFLRVFGEGFSDACRQGQAQVGVNIDLGAAGAPGDLDVGLGNAGGVGAELAAVLINLLDEILGNTGGAMEHERIITQAR